jgi:hypothetical protein
MTLKTRRPSGAVPWPLILIEGPEKAGKTWQCAALSASDRIGQMYWIDLGEGSADEYGAIPGANYLIVEHDGSFASIYAAVEEIYEIAAKAAAAGEPPVALTFDSMNAEWDLLKDWATNRAKGSASNRKKLQQDPHAEIVVSGNYWNDANSRHRKLMKLLMTFPGIALMTARGKVVAAIGENGQPIEGKKEYRVEGQKTLGFDASCWIRLSRDEPPIVVGARSVHTGIRPGRDEPLTLPEDWSLEWVIFEALKCDPSKAHVRDLVEGRAERTPEQIREEALKPTTSFDRLGELYKECTQQGYDSVIVPNERNQEELLLDLIKRLGVARKQAEDSGQQRLAQLRNLWSQADFGDDRDARIQWMAELLGRPVESDDDLSADDMEKVGTRLAAYIKRNTPPAESGPVAA